MSRKNAAAVALGRRGGKVGGLSRSPKLQAARRRNARKAGLARLAKKHTEKSR